MAAKLPKVEVCIYYVIWISSVSYSFYCVYLDGDKISSNDARSNDFREGWKIVSRKKDVSDDEWEIWTDFLFKITPWLILHLCLSEFTRLTFIEALPLCYLFITMGVLIFNFPSIVPALFILQLVMFFAAMMTSSKFVIWFVAVIFLIFINYGLKSSLLNHVMDNDRANLIYVSFGWFYIRCLDFVLAEVGRPDSFTLKFFNFLAYIFYLPCFFLGPFIPYDHFKFQLFSPSGHFLKDRAHGLFISLLVYGVYFILYEFASHIFYCNAMHYGIRDMLPFGMWTVSGIGICMANFFYLKYVIIYGFCLCIAKAENYIVPPRPKCIYRIHLYSKMWRHFDRGFYLFIFRCIYSPICKNKGASIKRRMFASFVCFLFVYIWHGGSVSILYWSAFNFIGLVFEALIKTLWNESPVVKHFVVNNLSNENVRRLEALAAAPLWLFAVISNFIFFGGHDMGLMFIEQLIEGSFLFYITLFIIAYSMCQSSIETEKYEQEIHIKNTHDE